MDRDGFEHLLGALKGLDRLGDFLALEDEEFTGDGLAVDGGLVRLDTGFDLGLTLAGPLLGLGVGWGLGVGRLGVGRLGVGRGLGVDGLAIPVGAPEEPPVADVALEGPELGRIELPEEARAEWAPVLAVLILVELVASGGVVVAVGVEPSGP